MYLICSATSLPFHSRTVSRATTLGRSRTSAWPDPQGRGPRRSTDEPYGFLFAQSQCVEVSDGVRTLGARTLGAKCLLLKTRSQGSGNFTVLILVLSTEVQIRRHLETQGVGAEEW